MTHKEMMLLPASKDRAILANSAYYYTGKACRKGHFSHRYTSSANCVACVAEKRGKPQILSKGKPRVSAENQRRAVAALDRAMNSYTPEKPCNRGHFERCVTTHNCIPCRDNTEKYRQSRKWQRLQKVYGLSRIGFEEILFKQGNVCAICNSGICENSCHVDHCHTKGHVRGLLCQKCNQAIGLFSESAETMMKAIKYLKENS